MIISPNRHFVFVHVHKCAGTSIEMALSSRLTVNDLVIGSTEDGERNKSFFSQCIRLKKHSSAQDAQQILGESLWKTYFTFGFVREPVDRLRSLHSYALGLASRSPLTDAERQALSSSGKLPNRAPYKFKAVQSAVTSKDFDAFLRNPLTWQDAGAKPQWQSLCDTDGGLIVDFVGKVEHMDRDWPKVQKRLNLDVTLGTENRSSATSKSSPDLSPEAWKQLRKHCLRDYRIFKYPVPAPIQALVSAKPGHALPEPINR